MSWNKPDIKLVVFDLDGVLVDAREIHFECLNEALKMCGLDPISKEDHLNKFDGLPTKEKLRILNVPDDLAVRVDSEKKVLTEAQLRRIPVNPKVVELFKWLDKEKGIKVHVASNARRSTIDLVLQQIGVGAHWIWDPSHVRHPKPAPEVYVKAMENAGVRPEQTLILEDSLVGLKAARDSKAHVLPVFDPADVSKRLVERWMETGECGLTVVVPMAGDGTRFAKAGHKQAKPFIDVGGRPLIQVSMSALGYPEAKHVFLVRKELLDSDSSVTEILGKLRKNSEIIPVGGLTEGAACTVALSEKSVLWDSRLLVANCDQLAGDSTELAVHRWDSSGADGGIFVFKATDKKWSYAKLGSDGWVERVAEKEPISDMATCGVYYWKLAKDFYDAVRAMVSKNDRTNNEFYVCPAFNHAIAAGKKFLTAESRMVGLGTPEDVQKFLGGSQNTLDLPDLSQPRPAPVVKTVTSSAPRKPKIAVCLSGHTRVFEQTYESLFANVVQNYDVDVFIHTWNLSGYREGHEIPKPIDEERIRQIYKPRMMVVELVDDPAQGVIFRGERASPYHMFRKIRECDKLRLAAEAQGEKYDWVIRARFDVKWTHPIPYNKCKPQTIYIPEGSDHGGTNDQLAWGTPECMAHYSSCVEIKKGESPHPETILKASIKDFPVDRIKFLWELCAKKL